MCFFWAWGIIEHIYGESGGTIREGQPNIRKSRLLLEMVNCPQNSVFLLFRGNQCVTGPVTALLRSSGR